MTYLTKCTKKIVAQAGCKNAITIATNMAGRGTDIVLGGNPKSITLSTLERLFTDNQRDYSEYDNFTKSEFLNIVDLLDNISFPENITTYNQAINYFESSNNLTTELESQNKLKLVYDLIYENKLKNVNTGRTQVQQLGGLHVIGTERHDSRRIDNQLRGRAGRQGDSGSSRFFLSLEDKLLRIFGGEKISTLMQNIGFQESVPIQSTFLNQSLESAQKKVEAYYFDMRKKLFEYDQALNTQRSGIYSERRRILEIENLRDWIIEYAERSLYDVVIFIDSAQSEQTKITALQKVCYLLGIPFKILFEKYEQNDLIPYLRQQLQISYTLKEAEMELVEPGLIRELERSFLLQQIDFSWKEHLQKISFLKDSVGWRAYGQKNPLTEYKQEAYNVFVSMLVRIRHRVTYFILRTNIIFDV